MSTAELYRWSLQVRADLDRLGGQLLDLDGDPTTKLVAAGGMTGSSAAPSAAATAALDRLWALLTAVRGQLDTVEQQRAKGRKADEGLVARSLTDPVIEVDPGLGLGRLTMAGAMNRMTADYATASEVIARIGGAWRDGLPLLDQGRVRLEQLRADLGSFPESDRAAEALARSDAAAATDPLLLGETLGPLRQALDVTDAAAGNLQARRMELPGQLHDAAELLARVDRMIREGSVALDETRAKITAPAGLLAPLDPAALLDDPGPGRGLGPWLERLRVTAGTDWRAAVNGLVAWRRLAEGISATAEQVRAANRAPLDRRNELRGLLDALAVKAAAAGRAEDPDLSASHERARSLLYVAPCDLDAAAVAVDGFGRSIAPRAPRPEEDQR